MKAMDMDSEVMARAFSLIRIAENVDIRYVTEMVTAWLSNDLTQATQIVLAMALLADENKALRQAHATNERLRSNGLEIPPEIEEMEREYQRLRTAKNRRVRREMAGGLEVAS